MRILFTDGIGAAVLHSGKPAPANRASNWVTKSLPAGDSVNRDSDDRLFMFALHDNFGCTFDMTGIPVQAQKTNLIEVNGDIVGTIGSAPTGFAPQAPNLMAALVTRVPSGTPGDVGYNGILAKHTRDTGTGDTNVGLYSVTVTNGHHLTGTVWVYLPSAASITQVVAQWENTTIGSLVQGIADLSKRDQWQQLTTTATVIAGGSAWVTLRLNAVNGTVIYSDLWSVTDADDGLTTRMVDVADRLIYWLQNGGTCEVDTGDYDGSIYATCGLAPGTTPSLVLSDKKNLEYTLSLALINVAVSPVRMACHYV